MQRLLLTTSFGAGLSLPVAVAWGWREHVRSRDRQRHRQLLVDNAVYREHHQQLRSPFFGRLDRLVSDPQALAAWIDAVGVAIARTQLKVGDPRFAHHVTPTSLPLTSSSLPTEPTRLSR